jgi:hypothetical protein
VNDDPLVLAAAAGLTVEVADLGDWSPAALVSEYDPPARTIRVNRRLLDLMQARRGIAARAAFLRTAVAHELYHHRVAAGALPAEPDRRASERAAHAFARAWRAR